MKIRLAILLLLVIAGGRLNALAEVPHLPLEVIVSRMMDHKRWQDEALLEYRALRYFQAANPRFRAESSMEVESIFRRAEPLCSTILQKKGSKLIQDRVFQKILEAECEVTGQKRKEKIDVTPENYEFRFLGTDTYEGRPVYRLGLAPRRSSQYLIQGAVWVDAEDFGIARITGSPAKRPSFWTLRVTVDRLYQQVQGIWLPRRLESVSDILIVGSSSLSVDYTYVDLRTGSGVLE